MTTNISLPVDKHTSDSMGGGGGGAYVQKETDKGNKTKQQQQKRFVGMTLHVEVFHTCSVHVSTYESVQNLCLSRKRQVAFPYFCSLYCVDHM